MQKIDRHIDAVEKRDIDRWRLARCALRFFLCLRWQGCAWHFRGLSVSANGDRGKRRHNGALQSAHRQLRINPSAQFARPPQEPMWHVTKRRLPLDYRLKPRCHIFVRFVGLSADPHD
ncbi:MAG: hypothetical protein ACJ8I3_02770 [Paraburkholderia graminis]